jgi:aryl-alcohol dehydrogenase-like predicted oxidoreductase
VDIPLDLLDAVQLPLSLYDQRLLRDGTISRLYSIGCEIHARSVFLQGLLLSSVNNWPSWVDPGIKKHHSLLQKYCSCHSVTLLDMALGFIRSLTSLETAVVGVTSAKELVQLSESWHRFHINSYSDDQWKAWSIEDCSFLDPRSWPS